MGEWRHPLWQMHGTKQGDQGFHTAQGLPPGCTMYNAPDRQPGGGAVGARSALLKPLGVGSRQGCLLVIGRFGIVRLEKNQLARASESVSQPWYTMHRIGGILQLQCYLLCVMTFGTAAHMVCIACTYTYYCHI